MNYQPQFTITPTLLARVESITALLSRHYSYGQDKMLAMAHQPATADQRKALAAARGV